jgi:hypothetical protein
VPPFGKLFGEPAGGGPIHWSAPLHWHSHMLSRASVILSLDHLVCDVVTVFISTSRPKAGWSFSLCPDAGEGGGSFQSAVRRIADYVARGATKDPERAAAKTGRRARGQLRR